MAILIHALVTRDNLSTDHKDEERDSSWQCFKHKGLHVLHLNVRSLLPKIDELRILTGDFNTNIGSIGNNTLVNYLQTFCSMFDLHQIIKDPTRVCSTSQSTIDLILVSVVQKITQSGVIVCGMSDHMVTYCTRKVCKQQVNCHNSVNILSMKFYSKEVFCERLSIVNWDPIITCNDVDQTWLNFKTVFIGVLDSIAPTTKQSE